MAGVVERTAGLAVTLVLIACDSGRGAGERDAARAMDATPDGSSVALADAALDGASTHGADAGEEVRMSCVFPEIRRSGASATLLPLTAGRCDGNRAVVCVDAAGGGRASSVECGADRECRAFTMRNFVSASPTDYSSVAEITGYSWATCVPRGAESVEFALDSAGTWRPSAPARCEGRDRLMPHTLAQIAMHEPRSTAVVGGASVHTVSGSSEGVFVRLPCTVDQRCERWEGRAVCVLADARPCARSYCDGSRRVVCEFGFEVSATDCGRTGDVCVDPDRATCASGEASCQPPGAVVCDPDATSDCASDERALLGCPRNTCVRSRVECGPSLTCVAGRGCVDATRACDPRTFAATCGATSLTYCDRASRTRVTVDCAGFGMVCESTLDPAHPSGARAGCASRSLTSDPCAEGHALCSAADTVATCCGSLAEATVRDPRTGTLTTVQCVPNRPTHYRCSSGAPRCVARGGAFPFAECQ